MGSSIDCWGSPSMGWKRISRHRAFQKEVSLLIRTKNREKVGTASPMGWSPDRTGKADRFRELIVNFLASRERKFLLDSWQEVIGWGAIGCLLEWASLLSWESGSLLPTIRGLLARFQRGSVSFGGDLDSGFHYCGLGARPHTCGLGAWLNSCCIAVKNNNNDNNMT